MLPDAVLVEIAMAAPKSPADLPKGHRSIARYQRQWLDAVRRAQALPEAELPPLTLRSDGPPPQRAWGDRDPVAAERLATARAALTAFAEEHAIPVENVLSPDPLRRVIWTLPADRSAAGVAEALRALGCRRWQSRSSRRWCPRHSSPPRRLTLADNGPHRDAGGAVPAAAQVRADRGELVVDTCRAGQRGDASHGTASLYALVAGSSIACTGTPVDVRRPPSQEATRAPHSA